KLVIDLNFFEGHRGAAVALFFLLESAFGNRGSLNRFRMLRIEDRANFASQRAQREGLGEESKIGGVAAAMLDSVRGVTRNIKDTHLRNSGGQALRQLDATI